MIDETDVRIVDELQRNARVANAEIARHLRMAPSAILERIRRLEERGVVRGYAAKVDPAAIGQGLLAFVFLRTSDSLHDEAVAEALRGIPQVLEVHDVAGEDSYLLKVRAGGPEELHALLRERLARVKQVASTRTVIVLKTWKESPELPLPEAAGGS